MAGLVIDASAATAVALKEIDADAAWLELVVSAGAIAPAHFPAEITNALVMAVRQKRIDEGYRALRLSDLADWSVEMEEPLGWIQLERVSVIAQRYKLSVYDAIYLDLALRTGLPLASYDQQLLAAAEKCGVTVLS